MRFGHSLLEGVAHFSGPSALPQRTRNLNAISKRLSAASRLRFLPATKIGHHLGVLDLICMLLVGI